MKRPFEQGETYRYWKQKDVKTEPKMTSFTDFPELTASPQKKTIFEGTSLANKLKEVIAAEEEAAIQKRLRKGDTPETLLRESCIVLPLKSSGKRKVSQDITVPDWVLDTTKPNCFRPFRPKSMEQIAKERYYARLGINPNELNLYDDRSQEEDDDLDSLDSYPMDDSHLDIPEDEQEETSA